MAWKTNSPEYIQNRATHKDTQELCKTNPQLVAAIKFTKDNQKIILEQEELPQITTVSKENPNITVSNKRTIQAARDHKGEKVCILNFASFTKPGGGVAWGCGAQEETLCHITSTLPCISDKKCINNYYDPHRELKNALHNDDIIYSPDVITFKNDNQSNPYLLPVEDWMKIDVLSCAAPNLGDKPTNRYNPDDGDKVYISSADLLVLLKKRAERILEVAACNGAEVLILGAFGCGAFHNPPELVAEAFANAIEKYGNCFKTIEFAIPGKNKNSDVFKKWFDSETTEKKEDTVVRPKIEVQSKIELPAIPNLIGQKINHNTFGSGIITEQTDDNLIIKFETEEKMLKFKYMFTGLAHLEDEEMDKHVCELAQMYKNNG